MNLFRYFLSLLSVSILLVSCTEHPHPIVSDLPQAKQVILLDSLQKLDSLILRNRTNKIKESFKYARQADKIAKTLNTPLAYAKAYNMFGNVYSLFKMDSGFYYYNQALLLIDSFNLVDNKAMVVYNLGMLHGSAGNYKTAIILLDSALASSRSNNDFVSVSNSLNALGNIYFDIGDETNARRMYDSAFAVAKTKSLYLQMGTALGNLSKFESDQNISMELNKRAITYLKQCNGAEEQIAVILINIANGFSNPDSAIHYFNLAIKIINWENAPEVLIGAYNNLAYSYLEKNDLINAEKCIVDQAQPISIKTNNIDWQSTVYDTYSDVLKRKGSATEAIVYKNKSIEARKTFSASVSTILPEICIASIVLTNVFPIKFFAIKIVSCK